jgi:hypothetical protein
MHKAFAEIEIPTFVPKTEIRSEIAMSRFETKQSNTRKRPAMAESRREGRL